MFKPGFSSLPLRAMRRTASAVSSSRTQLLQKKDDDVVITSAKRTAMGWEKKGQLKDMPVGELPHALSRCPSSFCCHLLDHIPGSSYSGENRVEPSGDW